MRIVDPVTVGDIADRLEVSGPTVCNWRTRYATFPNPRFTVGRGRMDVFEWADVVEWYTAPRAERLPTGRPTNRNFGRVRH